MTAIKLLAAGNWEPNAGVTTMTTLPLVDEAVRVNNHDDTAPSASAAAAPALQMWQVGQFVEVQPRTWAGINRPGGHGRITNIEYSDDNTGAIVSLDVKYTLGGFDRKLDPCLVKPYEDLGRGGRPGRGRREPSQPPVTQAAPAPKAQVHEEEQALAEKENAKALPTKRKANKPSKTGAAVARNRENKEKLNCKKKRSFGSTSTKKTVPSTPDTVPRRIKVNLNSGANVSPLATDGVESNPNRMFLLPQSQRKLQYRRSPPDNNDVLLESNAMVESPARPQQLVMLSPVSRTRSLASGQLNNEDDNLANLKVNHDDDEKDENASGDIPEQRGRLLLMSLEQVYDRERKKANVFINELVDNNEATKQQADEHEAVAQQQANQEPVELSNERFNSFLSIFNSLLQENDGAVQEDGICELVNETAKQQQHLQHYEEFTHEQVTAFIAKLCQQNKVMRSGDILVHI